MSMQNGIYLSIGQKATSLLLGTTTHHNSRLTSDNCLRQRALEGGAVLYSFQSYFCVVHVDQLVKHIYLFKTLFIPTIENAKFKFLSVLVFPLSLSLSSLSA